jgi:hypothetical protein
MEVNKQVEVFARNRTPLEHPRVLSSRQAGSLDVLVWVLLAIIGEFGVVRDEFPRSPSPNSVCDRAHPSIEYASKNGPDVPLGKVAEELVHVCLVGDYAAAPLPVLVPEGVK